MRYERSRSARNTAMNHAMVRSRGAGLLDLDTFARSAGLHPELVRRFVTLGLLEAELGDGGVLRFPPGELAAVARIQRLRAAFSLNYAAIGLVVDLLDRIAELEAAARRSQGRPPRSRPAPTGGRSWT